MMHSPIQLQNIALTLPHKICFEGFTTQIHHGSRIALIGENGCGKSTLLKILQGKLAATAGDIQFPGNSCIGYVPQVIPCFDVLSGGERFNRALTVALSIDPNILLLDEPTNHLDYRNRKSLMRMLNAFQGTLIVASHDVALLRNCVDTLWHIDNGKIQVFSGHYDDYRREVELKRTTIKEKISYSKRQTEDMHEALMKEQQRASKSRAKGEKSIDKRKWPTVVSKAKAGRGSNTANRKKAEISLKKQKLSEALSALRLPEIITPKFQLSASPVHKHTLVTIRQAALRYGESRVLDNLNFSIAAQEKIAILGDNGSGKSTLVKAILNDAQITRSGIWELPKPEDIGYLDQHYGTLCNDKTVLETLEELVPTWSHTEIREHLKDFLFRKNEEVTALVATLSGGEKVRLSLAQIAAKMPKLLILDEVTNNLDLTAREHIIQVLCQYPGAMIVISHDEAFLQSIKIDNFYKIENKSLNVVASSDD